MKTAPAKTPQLFAPKVAAQILGIVAISAGLISTAHADEHQSERQNDATPSVLLSSFGTFSGLQVPPAVAAMQSKAQSFSVRFEEVTNSCEPRKISLGKSSVAITPSGKRGIAVSIPTIPELKGRSGKRGKFSARAKVGKTIIKGIDGKFSIAGTVKDGGEIEFVFIAEYYKGKEPLCTTTWNGSGTKK